MPEISKTLDQGLSLLALIADDSGPSVNQLAVRSGLNRTVVHRLVSTLEGRGFVRRGPGGELRLGAALIELGDGVERDVRSASRIPLEMLRADTGETAVLAVPDGDEAVAIDQVVGGQRGLVRVEYRAGFRHPLQRAAHGKAMLAFLDLTDDPELELVRRRGYAVSHNELQMGASGIAAPVRDRTGTVVASIGIVSPMDRFPSEEETAPSVLEAAAAASLQLGYSDRRPHHNGDGGR